MDSRSAKAGKPGSEDSTRLQYTTYPTYLHIEVFSQVDVCSTGLRITD